MPGFAAAAAKFSQENWKIKIESVGWEYYRGEIWIDRDQNQSWWQIDYLARLELMDESVGSSVLNQYQSTSKQYKTKDQVSEGQDKRKQIERNEKLLT